MSEKLYLSAQGLLEDAFRLAAMVLHSGFEPTFITAIWRGGAPIGIAVQEFIQYHGVDCDHIAIRTSSYSGPSGFTPTKLTKLWRSEERRSMCSAAWAGGAGGIGF